MYIKLIFKETTNNKQIYSSRLYKYRDSYVLFIPTVHAFGAVKLTHTLCVQTHRHDVPPPWYRDLLKARIWDIFQSMFHCVQLDYTTSNQTSVLRGI